MPSRAEAQEERQEAVVEIRDEGSPVLLRHNPSAVASGGRERTPVAAVDVQAHAVFKGFALQVVDGEDIRQGDVRALVADAALGALANVIGDMPAGQSPGPTSVSIYVERDPDNSGDYPTPGDPGVQRFDVVRRLETKNVGAWRAIHWLQARAA